MTERPEYDDPAADGSRLEAASAGERHEALDQAEHTAAHHSPDPNAGVVRATPPSAGALWLAVAAAAVTLLVVVLLAVRIG